MDSISACRIAQIENGIPQTTCFAMLNLIVLYDSQTEDIDQRIFIVASLQKDLTSDNWYTNTITICSNS